jgi:hypothetical protein
MCASFYRSLAVCAFMGMALPLFGQTTSGKDEPCKVPSAPVKHQPKPFTAEFKVREVRTLSNGATITQESSMVQARDSQIRFLHSTTMTQQYGDHTPMTIVNIQDPVAGTQSSWDSRSRREKVIKLPPLEEQHGCWQSANGNYKRYFSNPRPSSAVAPSDAQGKSAAPANAAVPLVMRHLPVVEDLGTMTIEGVEARGQRETTTTAAGEIGNDLPLVSTQDTWIATGFGIVVRMVTDDPQQGKRTMELVKLDQGEPDPVLFQPPEGYEIVTEEMVPCKE